MQLHSIIRDLRNSRSLCSNVQTNILKANLPKVQPILFSS